MPDRLVGHTLGRYQVRSLLGSGGFAWVYAATDPELGVDVALKVLKPQYAGDPSFEERFRREASTAAKLRHPNIIKIYSVGRDEGRVYFAMDLYSRRLSQQIEVMHVLPEQALLKLGLDIASALGFAHRQGVIHRDIKADNILFDDHGNAIVADFGIARAAAGTSDQTGTNVILGTPHFFAPEQARGLPVDARADIYSLGVTLFLAATGELPFRGTDWYEIATQHVQAPIPSPRALNPLLTPEFERIILRCLEKRRDDRYASAELLYGELESLARLRASDSNAATIMVATPATGRNLAIGPSPAERPSRALSVAAFAGAFLAAALVFALVESGTPLGSPVPRLGGATVQAESTTVLEFEENAPRPNPERSGRGVAAVEPVPASGPANRMFVTAPEAATILVNDVRVGRGSWSADTLRTSPYRVTAELPVSHGCTWGRDATVVDFRTGSTVYVTLRPRLCGNLTLEVTKDLKGIEANFEVRSDSGELLRDGRAPYPPATFVLPTGKHRLIVRVPLCAQYDGEINIVADSTTYKPIPLVCGED